jgi:hypothetical protein
MNTEENVNLETVKADKADKADKANEALEFDQIKKQLKPRLKKLSKSNLIDIALRLSIEVTMLKAHIQSTPEVEVKKPIKTKKAAKAKKDLK